VIVTSIAQPLLSGVREAESALYCCLLEHIVRACF
jgi:hypothetical protein